MVVTEVGLGIVTPSRVLIVEDESLIRSAIADELREIGLTVVEAANADEAWRYLNGGAPVDIVFSDVQMPGSMNGIELARRLKAAHPALPVILTSGNTPAAAIEGIAPFLPKPYQFDLAVSYIVGVLKKHGRLR